MTVFFQAHGDADQVVSYQRGLQTNQILQKYLINLQFEIYASFHLKVLNIIKECTVILKQFDMITSKTL